MSQKVTIFSIILLWIISFVEPSGWSLLLQLPEKINFLIVIISLGFYLMVPNERMPISSGFVVAILLFLVIIPYLVSQTWQGASYVVSFLTTYIISQGTINPKVIKKTAIPIAGLGLFILYIYIYGSILSGWNDNAISMVGLFSFIYFSIFLVSVRSGKSFWRWNIVTLLYMFMLFQTDCRSGMLFSIISVVGIYYESKVRNLLSKKNLRLLLLNIPILISLLVIGIASTSYYEELNYWSIINYQKTIFNGREFLWDMSFSLLEKSNYIGTGKFMINYHNSGVAALSVFGVIGYIVWIKFFSKNLTLLSYYIKDKIVFGSILAFLLIYLQQSVDLGLIGEYPNLLPYMILGVGLGRIRLLKTVR